jgi:putative transposase
MAKKRLAVEQIMQKLREAELELARGQTVPQVAKKIGVTEQTYYRWRKEYGGCGRCGVNAARAPRLCR